MRVLNQQEVLAVTGAHASVKVNVAVAALPKINLSALLSGIIAKIKAAKPLTLPKISCSKPTTPSTPEAPETTDTPEDTSDIG